MRPWALACAAFMIVALAENDGEGECQPREPPRGDPRLRAECRDFFGVLEECHGF